jgi:hypothetical protein
MIPKMRVRVAKETVRVWSAAAAKIKAMGKKSPPLTCIAAKTGMDQLVCIAVAINTAHDRALRVTLKMNTGLRPHASLR